ncbi:MAG: hypothetical protein DWQ07_19680 [Chloroflexi bacterium]|nr:MAG: hypothetical protein DWQ07_19680 [Chloroflexota bacterium]MBL1194304.1 hypothetical protein [Chloroflexota bacterium]
MSSSIFAMKQTLKQIRHQYRRMRQQQRFGELNAPILFGNSFPKSGTHLLTQVLAGFAELGPVVDSGLPAVVTFDGPTGKQRTIEAILKDLRRFQPGDVGYGHLHALPEVVDLLCSEGVAPFFIYRDPRDVVVSHVFYVTEMAPEHVHHSYYKNELSSFDERLRTSILGRPELDISFPDIRTRFEPYLEWLHHEEVLSIRFEDFIEQPQEILGRVFDHVSSRGFVYNGEREAAIQLLRERIAPKRSPTFRSGKTGAWREHFNAEHTALFKEVTGDLLEVLGYARDSDW